MKESYKKGESESILPPSLAANIARCPSKHRQGYQATKTASEWNGTVTRMVKYARGVEGFFKPGEAERITQFLSATQTPDTFRNVQPVPSDAVGRNNPAVSMKAALSPAGLPTIGVLIVVFGVFGLLLFRPNRAAPLKNSTSTSVAVASPMAPSLRDPNAGKELLLQLVRTERQTPDCISLRLSARGKHAARQTGTIPDVRLAAGRTKAPAVVYGVVITHANRARRNHSQENSAGLRFTFSE